MRNLKRALSLALASVMLLGMMVVGTSAASYSDVSSEDNVEAIEVLNAVKVMIGKRGSFDPDAPVNRHEMATILAKLYLGSEEADNYVGSHPFTDVYPWADKYVAACYENDLISGTSKTTFGGNQPLTAVQAALMMLRALGYEDLTKGAADWRTPVAAKANQIRLFKDVTANPSAQLTRNEVAQLALNTLKSDVVETERGADVTIGDVAISTSLKYNRVEIAGEASANYAGGTTGDAGLGYQQLCEKLYGTGAKGLKLSNTTDAFGRTAIMWRYDGKEVGKYANDAGATYTDKVKIKDIYSDLGLSDSTSASLVLDGTPQSNVSLTKTGGDLANSGKGALVEVYKDSNDNLTICIINTYAGKVSRVIPAKDDNDRYITISGAGTFETEGFEKDDIVLYTKAGSDIKTVTLAESVSDCKVTKFTGTAATASKFTAGGSDYELSAKGSHKDAVAIDSSYDLYFDNYGYVIYTELYGSGESNYAYVLDTKGNGGYQDEQTYNAMLLLTDGTTVDVPTDKDYTTNKYDVVTYTVNSDNEYELTKKTDGAVSLTPQSGDATVVKATMKPGTAKIDVSSKTGSTDAVTSVINANSSTVFVVGNRASASDKYTYTLYTGIANVPKIDDAEVAAIAASDGTIAKYVFIQALDSSISSSDSDKTIFIKGKTVTDADKLTGEDKTEYYEYTAMVDGEETTLKVKAGATVTGVSDLTANVWVKTVSENKDGYITAVTAYPSSGAADVAQIKTATGTDRDGDAVKINTTWYTLDEDAPVVVVDGDDMYAGSVTDVDESSTDVITAVVKDGKITAMAVERKSADAPTGVTIKKSDDGDVDKVTIAADADNAELTLKASCTAAGTKTYTWTVTGSATKAAVKDQLDQQKFTFTEAGTYTVTVTARNTLADGQYAEASASVEVVVEKAVS